jgi:chloride channel protein, CIC family
MARYGSERIRGHGIPEAIEAILIGGSRMQPRVAVLKPISSGIAIGSGGPFGPEGPIIMTGGALGSIVGQGFHLSASERKTLLVAGAAAGMSATFATPFAAVLLAVELLPPIPVGERSALSRCRARLACAADVRVLAVRRRRRRDPLGPAHHRRTAAEDLFKRVPIHWIWWPALGGLVIGLGGSIPRRYRMAQKGPNERLDGFFALTACARHSYV